MATEIAFETGTYPANHNSPTQVVLAGVERAIEDAQRIARSRGLRANVLPVRGAFHTPLMESARAPFAAALSEVEVLPPRVPVISGATAAPFGDIRAGLVDALTLPCAGPGCSRRCHALGARRFLEVGPGDVLTGLVRKTLADVEATTVAELARALRRSSPPAVTRVRAAAAPRRCRDRPWARRCPTAWCRPRRSPSGWA